MPERQPLCVQRKRHQAEPAVPRRVLLTRLQDARRRRIVFDGALAVAPSLVGPGHARLAGALVRHQDGARKGLLHCIRPGAVAGMADQQPAERQAGPPARTSAQMARYAETQGAMVALDVLAAMLARRKVPSQDGAICT